MAATAIFSAEASKFFAATKRIKAELKDLKAQGAQIPVGGTSASASKAATAASRAATDAIKQQTAELKKQEQAARTAAAEIRAETEAMRNYAAAAAQAVAESRSKTAASNADAAASRAAAAETNKVTAALKQSTVATQQQIAETKAQTATSQQQAAASNARAAGSRADTAATNSNTAAIRSQTAEQGRQAAVSRNQAAASNANTAALREQTAEQGRQAATSRNAAAGSNASAAATRATTAAINQSTASLREQSAQLGVQAQGSRNAAASSNAQAAGSRAVGAAANATAAQVRAQTAAVNQGSATNRQNASASNAQAAASRAQGAASSASAAATREQTAELNRQMAAARKAEQETARLARAQRQAAAATKQATGEAGFLTKAYQRFGATMVAFATGYLVIQGLGTAFGVLKDAIYDFPAALEQTRVGFVGLFGSTEAAEKKADGLIQKLKELAIPSPYELADLAPMAQQTLAFDLVDKNAKDAAKQTVEFLRDIGDAAFGLGRGKEGADRLNLALGQMKVSTRVMGQEMLQMQQLGLNAWKYLAEGLGVTTRAARKMVTDGLVPADQAIRAIRVGIQRDFGGSMERASKTVLGAISQIRDTLRVVLSDEFKSEFTGFSQYIVRMADYMGTNAFKAELREKIVLVREALAMAKETLVGLYDTIKAIGPGTIGFFLTLGGIIKGSPLAAITAFAYALNTLTHWDEATTKAKALTAAIVALGVASSGIKVNAAITAASGGMTAAMMGRTASTAGISIFALSIGKALLNVRQFGAAIKTAVAVFGPWQTAMNIASGATTYLMASISSLALYALPVLVAALGVGGTMMEKYKEKSSIAQDANNDLQRSIEGVGKSFEGLKKYSQLNDVASKAVTNLKSAYSEANATGTMGALDQFIGGDLQTTKKEIFIDAKLRPFEKRLLTEEIDKLQAAADDQKIRLQAKLDADDLNKGWFSLKNFSEAFYQTWGGVGDWFKGMWGALSDTMSDWFGGTIALIKKSWGDLVFGITDGMKGLRKGLADAWYQLTGGFDSSLNRFLRGVADGFTGTVDTIVKHIKGAWKAVADFFTAHGGYAGNYGEDEGPELPSSMTAAERKRQKDANARLRESQGQRVTNGAGMEVAGPPVASPAQKAEEKLRQQRNKDEAEYNRLLKERNKIPTITPMEPEGGKDKKTKAQRDKEAADKRAAADAKKLRLDQLSDAASFYDAQAKFALESAKRQMAALQSVRDKFRTIFEDAQNALLKEGIINDPLGPLIRSFERWVALTPRMKELAAETVKAVQAARQHQGEALSKKDTLQGGDGQNPGFGSFSIGSKGVAANIAREAMRMEGVAGRFVRQCDRLADTTVRNVTGVFNKIMGPRAGDSAARTMARFMAAGIGFRPGKNQQYNPGDIVYTGNRVGRGAGHVQIIGADGDFHDQYGGHKRPKTRPEWVVRPDGSAPGTSFKEGNKFLPGQGKGSVSEALKSAGINPQEELKTLFENIDGSLSKIQAVPKAWGKAVRDTNRQTVLFSMQSQLANKDFQDMLMAFAVATKKDGQTVQQRFDQIIKKMRETGYAADQLKNKKLGSIAAQADIRGLDLAERMRGKEGDRGAALEQEIKNGKYQDATPTDKAALRWKTQRAIINDATEETHKFVRAEKDRQAVLAASAPFNEANTASLLQYGRAAEIAAKKLELWRSPRFVEMFKNGQGNKANSLINEQLKAFTDSLDANAVDDVTKAINEQIAAMSDQTQVMQWQQAWIKSGIYSQGQLANMAEAASQYLETYNKVLAANKGKLGEKAAADLAASEAQKVFDKTLATKGVASETEAVSEYNKILQDTKLAIQAANAQRDIYFSGLSGPKMERALAMAKEEARLKQEQATGKKLSDTDISDRLDLFGQQYDAEAQISAASEFAKSAEEAAKATALWGDMSGLAALKFEMQSGSLQSLSRAQKDQMLINQAAIDGMEKWGQEYDNLTKTQLGLAQQIDELGLELQGSPVTAAQRQQLEWKYQDIEAMARVAAMSDAQREAYLRQKEAVDALRASILPAIEAQEQMSRFVDNTKQLMGQLDGIWGQGLDQIYQGHVENFFGAISEGVSSLLNDVSKQILSSLITKAILGWFPQLATVFDQSQSKVQDLASQTLSAAGAATAAAAAYTAAATAAAAFAAISGIAGAATGAGASGDAGMVVTPPSGGGAGGGAIFAATGLKYVPRDMTPVYAHKGEAILPFQEAEAYRMAPGVFSGPNASGGTGQAVQVNNHYYTIDRIQMPEGTDANNFANGMQERASGRQQKQKSQTWLNSA